MKLEPDGIRGQMNALIDRICFLYPDVNRDLLELKVLKLNIVDNNDITDSKPMFYDFLTNSLKINYEVLKNENYDAEYLMTTHLLSLTLPYCKELSGIRYGYFSGVASMLVGNCVKETEEELIPGVDPYESLRSVVQDLSSKIGPEKVEELCRADSLEVFRELYADAGLENPSLFNNQMNYLFHNSLNISEKQNRELVGEITSKVSKLEAKQKKI